MNCKRLILSLFVIVTTLTASAQIFQHPWTGVKIGYLGDSITDPRNAAANKKYWALLSEWLKTEAFVYAKSGREWDDIPRQADLLMKEHGENVDAIIILLGTNDYNHSIPLGQWFTETKDSVEVARGGKARHNELRRHRHMDFDKGTLRGRINVAMQTLHTMYPGKQIVVLTPIHRALFDPNDKNVQPNEDYANEIGLFLSDYTAAIREVSDIWAVPVIDIASISGLYPMIDSYGKYFNNPAKDRLHPNNAGHERMAKSLYYQLIGIPVFK